MIKQNGIVSGLSWVLDLLQFPVPARRKVKKIALSGIRLFKKGKKSSEGEHVHQFLTEDCEFIGFALNMSYVMENSKYKDELNNVWVHPFSTPTLLYKVKGLPMLVVSNENLDYNNSALSMIESNKFNDELMRVLKNSRGIQG